MLLYTSGACCSLLLLATLAHPGALRSSAYAATRGIVPQPACSQDACLGLDPLITHCSDGAKTLQTTAIVYKGQAPLHTWFGHLVTPGQVVGRLDVRFSPSCTAYWGRVVSAIAPPSNAPGVFQVTLSDGAEQFSAVESSAYGNMNPFQPTITGSVTLTIGSANQPLVSASSTLAGSIPLRS